MAVLSKMKRDKREFLIGKRKRPELGDKGLTERGKSQARAQRIANEAIAKNNLPEENDLALQRKLRNENSISVLDMIDEIDIEVAEA
jgi:hypothetical protein